MADFTPDQAYELAMAQHMGGNLVEAERIYRLILEAVPGHGPTLQALGVLSGQKGLYLESENRLSQAAKALPDSADVWSNLGNVLRILEGHKESIEACQKAVQLQPSHAFAWGNLSGVLRMEGRIREAKMAAEKSLALAPDFIEAKVNLGCCHQALGEVEAASDLFVELTQKAPDSLYAWSCRLMNQLYDPRPSPKDLADTAREFGSRLPKSTAKSRPKTIHRVAFLSGDFCQHPVGLFVEPLLNHWDHNRHEVHLIINLSEGDEVTRRLINAVNGRAHFVQGLSDSDVCRLIEKLGIDLLVDLSGHTAKNRLGVVAAKPAPWMASWLGWSGTTGLRQMDFIIGDAKCLPEGCEPFYTEKPLRLPHSLFCLTPAAPETPLTDHEGLRLGSFNNPAKISRPCLTAWAELMGRLPEAILVMKYRGFSDPEVAGAFLARLEALGITRERVELHGWTTREDHWRLLASLDLGLDTWPYSGATTTTDFLQVGIPIPTLAGDRYVHNMSASVLAAAGAENWIAHSVPEWMTLMEKLAHAPETRSLEGRRVKEGLAASQLCDGPGFARDFQNLIDTVPRG